MRFRDLSIRSKLMLVLLLTSSGALFLSAVGYTVNDYLSYRQALFERLQSQADILGANSRAALLFEDPEAARQTLRSLKKEASIVAAAVFDQHERLFATYSRNSKHRIPDPLPHTDSGYLGQDIFVISAIDLEKEPIGRIFIRSDLRHWQERQIHQLLIAIGMMAASLLVAFLLARRMQRIVSEPILHLADTARRVSEQRNFSLRAQRLSGDEIGILVDDFNSMLQQIQDRDRRLQHHRDELEEQVQERTAELVSMTRQLEYQAFHDTLTGLANRALFDDHLMQAIDRSQRDGSELAVLFLDLDRFKVINDTLGHQVGDRLLVMVAKRFRDSLRKSDTIARLGGDEFAIMLTELKHPEYAADVARKLIAVTTEPFQVDSYSLHITTSVGISLYPEDGTSTDVLLKNADTAMYRSKELGRNRFEFISEELNALAVRRLSLENRLREAIQEDRLSVYYQQRLDLASGSTLALEALVRWHDPQEGLIMPEEFISLAEDCGLITVIDERVLELACSEVLSWYDGEIPDIRLSVNLSPVHFVREDINEALEGVLQRTGFPAERLELEITENVLGPEYADILAVLARFKARGIQLSIDDFGTGYSSLGRLKQLPIDIIKIDQSFVRDLGVDGDDEAIARTIISMAHSLNLRVVAEGVENQTQFDIVKSYGCDEVQGFLLGRPVQGKEIAAALGLRSDDRAVGN